MTTWRVCLYSSVIQVAAAGCPQSDYVTETRERWPLEGPAHCTHILLCPALFPAGDWCQRTVGVWSWYEGLIGGAEYVLCALSKFQLSQECSPLALTFILGADRQAVIYRISHRQAQAFHYCCAQRSQETLVYSEMHLLHNKTEEDRGGSSYLFASCIKDAPILNFTVLIPQNRQLGHLGHSWNGQRGGRLRQEYNKRE